MADEATGTGSFEPHTGTATYPGGQVAFLDACFDYDVVSALNGRGTGKSIALELLFWEEAARTDGFYEYIYVAQGHPQAEKTYKKFVRVCESKRGFLIDKSNKGQDRWVETRAFGANDGTRRHFWSGEPGALTNVRGPRANRLAVDEAGFVHKDVLPTCVPMLSTRDGKMTFVGTAKREGCGFTWFKTMFDRGLGIVQETDDEVMEESGLSAVIRCKSFNFPLESSPYLSARDIALQRSMFRNPRFPDEKTPEEAEECDGAFISDLGGCFRNIDAVVRLPYKRIGQGEYVGVDEFKNVLVPIVERRYIIGADWGQKIDHTVFVVFDRLTRDMVYLRVEPTGRPYDEYVTHLSQVKRYWNDALVLTDGREAGNYAMQRMASQFGERLRDINVTGKGEHGKGALVARVKDLFLNESWRILDAPDVKEQFSLYQQEPIGDRASGFHYGAPSGKHDDVVSACLLAAIVLQIEPRAPRPPKKEAAPYSTEWFAQRSKERRRFATRRAAW